MDDQSASAMAALLGHVQTRTLVAAILVAPSIAAHHLPAGATDTDKAKVIKDFLEGGLVWADYLIEKGKVK